MGSSNWEQHKKFEYCKTRLQYRQSNLLTAVKVYTIANESKHMLIFGVPRINLLNELKRTLEKYGTVKSLQRITDSFSNASGSENFEIEMFTDVYHVIYGKLQQSRHAKKFLDAINFYGGILHISYAPEYENLEDVVEKWEQRKKEVEFRIQQNNKSPTKKTKRCNDHKNPNIKQKNNK